MLETATFFNNSPSINGALQNVSVTQLFAQKWAAYSYILNDQISDTSFKIASGFKMEKSNFVNLCKINLSQKLTPTLIEGFFVA